MAFDTAFLKEWSHLVLEEVVSDSVEREDRYQEKAEVESEDWVIPHGVSGLQDACPMRTGCSWLAEGVQAGDSEDAEEGEVGYDGGDLWHLGGDEVCITTCCEDG